MGGMVGGNVGFPTGGLVGGLVGGAVGLGRGVGLGPDSQMHRSGGQYGVGALQLLLHQPSLTKGELATHSRFFSDTQEHVSPGQNPVAFELTKKK